MRRLIVLLIFVLTGSGYAQNKKYVTTNGNDSNAGTIDNPWGTIQFAADNVSAGDTIFIKAGTYSEMVTIKTSGTRNQPIVVKNYRNDVVQINASGNAFGIVFQGCQHIEVDGLNIFGADAANPEHCNVYFKHNPAHITIKNCDISRSQYGILTSKLWSDHTPHHISIINCKIYDHELGGIRIFGTEQMSCHHLHLAGNEIFENGHSSDDKWINMGVYIRCDSSIIEDNAIYNNEGDGMYMDDVVGETDVTRYCGYNIVRRNKIYKNGYNGIFLWHQFTRIYENDIHDNSIGFELGNKRLARAMHGIYMCFARYCIIYNNVIYNNANGSAVRLEGDYNVVRDNLFYNNGVGMYGCDAYGTAIGNIIRNNVMYGNIQLYGGAIPGSGLEISGPQNLCIYNNTILDNQGFGCALVTGAHYVSTEMKLKNNIFMNNDWNHLWVKEGSEKGYVETNNLFYPDKANGFLYLGKEYWFDGYKQVSGQGKQSICIQPNFMNQVNNDYHLTATSPCVDAGSYLSFTRSAGSGTQIPVQDVTYFCDGFGMMAGDLIQLEGETTTARITKLNRENHILTVDIGLSWRSGQGIHLAYYGSGPDIGAFETSATSGELSASLQLSEASPIKAGDLAIILQTNQNVVKVPTPLYFMESDGTQSTIELSGNTPGNIFNGIFKIDNNVASGQGYFFLAEETLESETGKKGNTINPGVEIVIDQIAPKRPQNVSLSK